MLRDRKRWVPSRRDGSVWGGYQLGMSLSIGFRAILRREAALLMNLRNTGASPTPRMQISTSGEFDVLWPPRSR